MARPDEDFRKLELDWAKKQIIKAANNGFYGKLIISMQDGRIRNMVKEESLKPPSEKSSC